MLILKSMFSIFSWDSNLVAYKFILESDFAPTMFLF